MKTGSGSSSVEVYDPTTDRWSTAATTTAPPLPRPVDRAAATYYNGKLYVVREG
jgi:hypothetical protein